MSAAITSLVITLAAGGYSAYTSYQNGKSQQALNNYNAMLEEQNAATQARDAAIQANQTRRQNQRVLASQRAAMAANGVVGDTGSPLLEQANQAGYLEMGALEVERQGNIASAQSRQQAVLDRARGSLAARAGEMEAVGTVLATGSKATSQYKGIR